MGVLEFFGSLVKHNITSNSITTNFSKKMDINHLLVDFNSIIHVSSRKILNDINSFLELILKNINENRSINGPAFIENFEKYKMNDIKKQINKSSSPIFIINLFRKHFTEKYLDKLIITLVINTILYIIRTYCNNSQIKTLLLAIDGVPSKGKMVEQRQRRYMGAITEEYEKKILNKYKKYLLNKNDYIYYFNKYKIKWNTNKITPGTGFMDKLVKYLKSEKIGNKIKFNRAQMQIIISDMYEIGEGEKKIVNYVNKYLTNTYDTIVIYSPDADVILLCMILPVHSIYMLRFNQQTLLYDIIDIHLLKDNISYYINNNPEYSKEKFDIGNINNDIVCISTIFGNDFVPKIETLNVKRDFQTILDAYLKTLLKLKDKNYYLIKKKDNKYYLNFTFFKNLLIYLLPQEDDFIKHNKMYNEYINFGQIMNVFNYLNIDKENIVSVFDNFRNEYNQLRNLIKNNGNFSYFETNNEFMSSLKKSLNIIIDNQVVNTTYLNNKEMIELLKKYYRTNHDFPKLNINLNTYSRSISDPYHIKMLKNLGIDDAYNKELYKFRHMLDEYNKKFNAQPLDLSSNNINNYYKKYFDIDLYTKNNTLTTDTKQLMFEYIQGILWVFNYYFNDPSYINKWYYKNERAPLIRHLLMYLESINLEQFNNIMINLDKYEVDNLNKYFNPLEQFIYVSPMTKEVIKLLPLNYQEYISSDNLDPFLKLFFINIEFIVENMWDDTIYKDIDCHNIVFFNKCLIKSINKPSKIDDKEFLKAINRVKPNEQSIKRSQVYMPNF